MPTSEEHFRLVAFLADSVRKELGIVSDLHADHRGSVAWPAPPQLGSARPDVFARRHSPSAVVIGEAKTRRDIEHPHTEVQLIQYFGYLKLDVSGELWMAVPWAGLDEMYHVATRCRRLADAPGIGFRVFGVAWERSIFCRTLRA